MDNHARHIGNLRQQINTDPFGDIMPGTHSDLRVNDNVDLDEYLGAGIPGADVVDIVNTRFSFGNPFELFKLLLIGGPYRLTP